jgi:hypothetical protein
VFAPCGSSLAGLALLSTILVPMSNVAFSLKVDTSVFFFKRRRGA